MSSGIAIAAKALNPAIRVVAAEPAGTNGQPDVFFSKEQGRPVSFPSHVMPSCHVIMSPCHHVMSCHRVTVSSWYRAFSCRTSAVQNHRTVVPGDADCAPPHLTSPRPTAPHQVGFPEIPQPTTICDGLRGHLKVRCGWSVRWNFTRKHCFPQRLFPLLLPENGADISKLTRT